MNRSGRFAGVRGCEGAGTDRALGAREGHGLRVERKRRPDLSASRCIALANFAGRTSGGLHRRSQPSPNGRAATGRTCARAPRPSHSSAAGTLPRVQDPLRGGRYGAFLSCTGYPACKTSRPLQLGVPCPKCNGDLIEVKSRKRGSRTFYGCANYAKEGVTCDFKLWQKPLAEPCPGCGAKFLLMGGTKGKPMHVCADKACGFKRPAPAPLEVSGEA